MLLVGCLRVGGGVLSTTWGAVSNVPNWPIVAGSGRETIAGSGVFKSPRLLPAAPRDSRAVVLRPRNVAALHRTLPARARSGCDRPRAGRRHYCERGTQAPAKAQSLCDTRSLRRRRSALGQCNEFGTRTCAGGGHSSRWSSCGRRARHLLDGTDRSTKRRGRNGRPAQARRNR